MKIWRVPYPKFGAGPGLGRVGAIARRLGVELLDFGETSAVIVGSNGKGSTAAMTAAILRQVGGPVGLFTSPHLFDLNERFNIDGDDICDDELEHHWRRVVAAAKEEGLASQLGGFEFLFLIAADWFAARDCKYTVWEAGIGGRCDPVRLIEARRLALTSLDLEHTDLLGDTLEEIARNKLDAAPSGAQAFFAASCAPQRVAIEAHCAMREVGVVWPDNVTWPQKLPLAGAYQSQNAVLAAALARACAGDTLSDDTIAHGLAATRWPGRLETISGDPLIVIDVGHTPRAVAAALEGFREMASKRATTLVCGASYDKSAAALIAALAGSFPVIVCAAARHKGAPASEIAAHALAANPAAEVSIAGSVQEARAIALARAAATGAATYVAGGLFLAAEFKAVHLGRDPATLAFF